MSGAKCPACPVSEGLECYPDPLGRCRRVAEPGQDDFRALVVRQARSRATQAGTATLLSPEDAARLRAAETCPHRDCVDCGCNGCRCKEGGRRAGEKVTIADCLECIAAMSMP
jgi:hypothetical protein